MEPVAGYLFSLARYIKVLILQTLSAISIFTKARHAKYTSGNSGRHSRSLAAYKYIT